MGIFVKTDETIICQLAKRLFAPVLAFFGIEKDGKEDDKDRPKD